MSIYDLYPEFGYVFVLQGSMYFTNEDELPKLDELNIKYWRRKNNETD